jgi:hypothetical protein
MLLLARERMSPHRVLKSRWVKPWRLTCNGRARPTAAWGLGPNAEFSPGLYAPVVLTIAGNDVGKIVPGL